MQDFYTELGRGSEKAEALRQAQLQLAHSETGLRKPFYWAAFNLSGEGSGNIDKEETE